MLRGFKTRCENISLQLRKELGLKDIDSLPSKDLAEHLGVLLLKPADIQGLSTRTKSLLLGAGRDYWSAITISFGGFDTIIYNSSHSRARQASDIMHELAHIILKHSPSQMLISSEHPFALRSYNQSQEEEAAWLSGCLLLPREALSYIKQTHIIDEEACNRYGTSQQLLTYRMNVTAVNYQYRRR